jgi:hypothetical protein
VNGKYCKFDHFNGYRKISQQIECKCPIKQSFRCGKLCTTDSAACDYIKSKENKKYFLKIKDCANHNSTYFKSYLLAW